MGKGLPSLKLVHSTSTPENRNLVTRLRRARLGVVRNELSFILGKSDDNTLTEISRMTPIARQMVKERVFEFTQDQAVADTVEHIPDMEHSFLEDGNLQLCFGYMHGGVRKVLGAMVDSKYRIGYFMRGETSDEAAFTLLDPEDEE